ncbi:MAG: hypothetical protein M0P47_00655 [Bacteroidales bacterium]|nr:hypothetical protein [Bacteroidales bacterium]
MKKNVIQYLAGRLIPAIVTVSLIVLAIHYFGPVSYGRLTLLYYTALICITLSFHWVQVSIVGFLRGIQKTSEIIISRFFFLTILSALASGLLMGAVGHFYFHLSWFLLALLVLYTFLSHFYLFHLAIFQSFHCTTRVAILEGSTQILVILVFVAGIFIFHWQLSALFFGSFIVGYVGMLILRWLIRIDRLYEIDLKHFYWDSRFTSKALKFSFSVTLWLLFSYILISADRFILAKYLGFHEMGKYAAFKDLVYQAIFFVGFPLYVSYQTKIVDLWNAKRKEEAWIAIKEALSFEILIFIVVFIIFMVFKSYFFTEILKIPEIKSWIIYLPLLLAAFLWQSTLLLQRFLELFYRPSYLAIALLATIIVNISLNLIFVPIYGIMASSVIMLISTIIYISVILVIAIRERKRLF